LQLFRPESILVTQFRNCLEVLPNRFVTYERAFIFAKRN